ncbi:uncharacterized protein [Embiotoca jacksoni]|uniref:uncharacterized protein n=1 Tax=Embiotoca jacksoni TaxID=100190 RepID=UPI0037049430
MYPEYLLISGHIQRTTDRLKSSSFNVKIFELESTMTQTTPTKCETTGLDVRTPQLVTAVSSLTTSYTSVKSASGSSTSALLPVTTLNPTSRLKPQMTLHYDVDGVLLIRSLPGSVKHDTTCNLYFGEGSHPVETTTMRKKRISKKQWFCLFTVTLEDFQRFPHSVQQKEVSCDYSSESEPNSLSPRSDGYSLTDHTFKPGTDAGLLPEHPKNPATEASVWKSAVAVAGFVTLVVILLVLARFIKRRTESHRLTPFWTFTTTTGSVTANLSPTTDMTSAVKQTENDNFIVDQTFKSGTDAGLLPEHPKNPGTESTVRTPTVCSPTTSVKPESEASVWKSAVAVAGFVTLVVILLVLARFIKRRTESCTYKRTHGSITASQPSVADDVVCMRNLDHGELLREDEGAYEVITSVSANGCSTGSEKLNRQAPQSENIPFRRSTYKTFLNLK